MHLADMDIDVPGIRDIPGALAKVAQRAASLTGRPIDHISVCVAAANLERYTGRVRDRLPGSRFGEYLVGEPDSGMQIAEIEDSESAIHLVFAAPTGHAGQVADFLSRNGAEGLQHIAFTVPDLRVAMSSLVEEGLTFVGGATDLDRAILEVREGDRWLRQTFTAPLFGEFFVELIERNGLTGLHPNNMQSLYELNEDSQHERPLPA